MSVPSELELLEFFCVEPERDGDVFVFQVSDSAGVTLRFSFDVIAGSVQSIVGLNSATTSMVCHECLQRIWIADQTLHGEFAYGNGNVTLTLKLHPRIQIAWTGLRTS